MKAITSQASRHIVVRFEDSETLPDSLLDALKENAVATGWVRASGVVTELEIKAFRSEINALGSVKRIAGPVQLVALEGSVGLARGELSVGLRAVIARETESGLETITGELVSARISALECFITALDDIAVGRTLDEATSSWLLDPAPGPGSSGPAHPLDHSFDRAPDRTVDRPRERESYASPKAVPTSAPAESPWAQAVAASNAPDRDRSYQSGGHEPVKIPIPQRPGKVAASDDDAAFPEAGDVVEHFAFGRCEVLKSDGDRLHLRVGKDGRVREIALEMLRVSPLESNEPSRKRFKLDRKL
ncbi:MAG: DUF296 domain-containing protein [Polyangiaceae bacterium]